MSPASGKFQSVVWGTDLPHYEGIHMPGGYIAIAVGAFLDFALKVHRVVLGINFHTLGAILIIVGSLSVILPVISSMELGSRRRRTVIENDVAYLRRDDEGYGLRRGNRIVGPTRDRVSRLSITVDPSRPVAIPDNTFGPGGYFGGGGSMLYLCVQGHLP